MRTELTGLERKMYQILGAVSATDAPIVFKGALITKLVLAEGGFVSFNRHTNDIDANWIGVLSGKYIFRRGKDLVDVYALAHCVRLLTDEIYGTLRNKHRELDAFTEFRTRRQDIEHAYNMLKGIEGKPDFSEVYLYLERFVSPFARKDKTPRVWIPDKSEWEQDFQKSVNRPSTLAHIRAAEQEREHPPAPRKKPKHKTDPEL
jgi:hypothetical protein